MIRLLITAALLAICPMLTNASVLYATSVVESTGSVQGAAAVNNVLGAPDLQVTDFLPSGGLPGFVTVSFSGPFADIVGADDIFIHLFDWEPDGVEQFRVSASVDGVTFSTIGETGIPVGGQVNQPFVVGFDLADSGLSQARSLKIENLFAFSEFSGPDIDAIEVHASTVPEPSAFALFAIGLLGTGVRRRRQHRHWVAR